MTIEEFEGKNLEETNKIAQLFTESLEIDEEIAHLLVAHGFSSLEEIAYVPKEELLAIDAFDDEIVEELRHRANDTLLTQALVGKDGAREEDDLARLEGISPDILNQLQKMGIATVDDLAEHSVDELLPIPGMTAEKAGALIMTARASWFTNANSNDE
jgi:N utilization substance protein A